jgi:hypothetical protein
VDDVENDDVLFSRCAGVVVLVVVDVIDELAMREFLMVVFVYTKRVGVVMMMMMMAKRCFFSSSFWDQKS